MRSNALAPLKIRLSSQLRLHPVSIVRETGGVKRDESPLGALLTNHLTGYLAYGEKSSEQKGGPAPKSQ